MQDPSLAVHPHVTGKPGQAMEKDVRGLIKLEERLRGQADSLKRSQDEVISFQNHESRASAKKR